MLVDAKVTQNAQQFHFRPFSPDSAIEDVLTELTEWVTEQCAGPEQLPFFVLYLPFFPFRKFRSFRPKSVFGFNGHHYQVPVTNGSGKLSVELHEWLPFLEKTIERWLKGNQAGSELFAVPELGPVRGGYNLAQLPNSWEDAKVLRKIIAKTWAKAVAA